MNRDPEPTEIKLYLRNPAIQKNETGKCPLSVISKKL